MYLMNNDSYKCDYCGIEMDWDESKQEYGDMWECEQCGTNFCSKCFTDELGLAEFRNMINESDKVLCPNCYKGVEEI